MLAASLLLGIGAMQARADEATPAPLAETPAGFGRAAVAACRSAQQPGCVCRVETLADAAAAPPGSLRACLGRQRPTWIVFSARGMLELRKPLRIPSNITLDGRALRSGDAPVTLAAPDGLLLNVADSENIVVTDLRFRIADGADRARPAHCLQPSGPQDTKGCGVPILIKGASRNIWIDHDSFEHCGEKCIAVWTETAHLPANARAAGGDLITISNSRFADSYFGVGVGADAGLTREALPAHMRVTLYGNLFDHVFRRSPRAAGYAMVHFFNNVVRNWGDDAPCQADPRDRGTAASAVGGAQLLLENNVFAARPGADGCKIAVEIADYAPRLGLHRESGKVRARGNLLLNGAQIAENAATDVFDPRVPGDPDHSYPYRLAATDGLERQVEASAGARALPGQAAP